MALRPILADWLAVGLFASQQVDQGLAKDETKHKRRKKRPARPNGYIAEKIEKIAAVRQAG
jgi:hypothetical protein